MEWKGTEFLRCYRKSCDVKRAITIISLTQTFCLKQPNNDCFICSIAVLSDWFLVVSICFLWVCLKWSSLFVWLLEGGGVQYTYGSLALSRWTCKSDPWFEGKLFFICLFCGCFIFLSTCRLETIDKIDGSLGLIFSQLHTCIEMQK